MKLSKALLFIGFLTFLASAKILSQGTQTPIYLDSTTANYGYYEYLPLDYGQKPEQDFPLVIFLHGLGEKGNGNSELSRVIKNGPPKLIKNGKHFPALVISPQSSVWWSTGSLNSFLDWLEANYRIDKKRIYVTGLSMGGGGTWTFAKEYSSRLAAIVPVCGAATVSKPENLVNLPIWAFHNDGDKTVPVSNTYGWINGIKELGGQPKMTIYTSTSHDAWTAAYNSQEMWDWLFAQPAPPSGISIEKVSINKSPLLNKKGTQFSISAIATDDNGEIGSVSGDLSSLGGGKALALKKSGGNHFDLNFTLTKDFTPGYYPIKLTFTDNNKNQKEQATGIWIVEQILEEGEVYDSYLINFNLGHNAPKPWNNMNANPVQSVSKSGFSSKKGVNHPFIIKTNSKWAGQNALGLTSGNNSGVFIDTVMFTNWYVNNETGELAIENLPAEFNYNITLTASRNGIGDRTTIFAIGNDTLKINASQNLTQKVSFKGISPDENNSIEIQVYKDKNAQYAYLNGMQIDFIAKDRDGEGTNSYKERTFEKRDNNYTIYPNPFDDEIGVNFEYPNSGETFLRLIDLTGKSIESASVEPLVSNYSFELHGSIPRGVYVLQITHKESVRVFKLLKK